MKHSKRTPIIVVIMALISFACLTLSVSYSYVMRSKVSADAMIITTGDLTSTVSYTSDTYTFALMSDSEGLAQEDYGIISINKNNIYSVFYKLSLGYAVDSLPSGKTVGDLIPLEHIRVALFTVDTLGNIASTPIIGPVNLADMTIASVSADSVFRDTYYLNYGFFEPGEQTVTYALKVWLSENTPETFDDHLVYLGVSVDQEPLVNKTISNLGGTVVDASGNAVASATIKFHNGKINAELDANKNFSLVNVPTGTYNLSVVSGGNEYKTTLHIKEGDALSLAATNGATGQTNTYLQNSAYTYYTSPGSILNANTLTTTSNQLSMSTYTIPNAYVLTIEESLSILDINNLVLTLNADYTLGISM